MLVAIGFAAPTCHGPVLDPCGRQARFRRVLHIVSLDPCAYRVLCRKPILGFCARQALRDPVLNILSVGFCSRETLFGDGDEVLVQVCVDTLRLKLLCRLLSERHPFLDLLYSALGQLQLARPGKVHLDNLFPWYCHMPTAEVSPQCEAASRGCPPAENQGLHLRKW
jgi:hypothetical protein